MTDTHFCPKCGSPRVDTSSLVGGKCSCRACSWSGPSTDLCAYEYQTDLLEGVDSITRFSTEIRNLMAKELALPLYRVLSTWGFVGEFDSTGTRVLARYVNAAAKATTAAILSTRDEIEADNERV